MDVLDLVVQLPDEDPMTVREIFTLVLKRLWSEGDSFSGKRPMGYSNWEFSFYEAMVKAGMVQGELDEDGYLAEISLGQQSVAHAMILQAIGRL